MKVRDYLSGETFSLEQQPEGWWKTTPEPIDLAPYYPQVYYGAKGKRRFPAVVEWLQSSLYRRRAKRLTTGRQPGSVLDIGCGPGHLLAAFRALGWQTCGTELTHEAADMPRKNYNLRVLAGPLETAPLTPGSFDLIVSWHTLEHMRDPGLILDQAIKLLRPDGTLLVSVPDFGSPEARRGPSTWFHLDVPRHLCHFPASALRAMLKSRGLIIEKESHGAPEYDTFSIIQSAQNRMGLPHNLLYLLLKGSGGNARPSAKAAVLSLAVLMLPAAAIRALWRAMRGTGAVVTLQARKPSARG
jgi:SAM-dependent methyltransferase